MKAEKSKLDEEVTEESLSDGSLKRKQPSLSSTNFSPSNPPKRLFSSSPKPYAPNAPSKAVGKYHGFHFRV